MRHTAFENRAEAGRLLGERLLQKLRESRPLVVAIPRGGMEVAAPIVRLLDADVDLVLARKLRAPWHPEYAIGALSEAGDVYLNPDAAASNGGAGSDYLGREWAKQGREVARMRSLYRSVWPKVSCADRSVVVVDDGVATGSTMIAALRALRAEHPAELWVATPVAPTKAVEQVRQACDHVECLLVSDAFAAVAPFYLNFEEVPEDRVIDLLCAAALREMPTSAEPLSPVRRAMVGHLQV